jgi:hypothetical protein
MRSKTFSSPPLRTGVVHLLLAALIGAGLSPAFAHTAPPAADAAESAKETVAENVGERADDANAFTFSAWRRLHGRTLLAAPAPSSPASLSRGSTPPSAPPSGAQEDFRAELDRALARPAPPDLKALSRHSLAPRPQSGSQKSKKGPVTAILIGLGLIGGGAYLMATYKQPTTLTGLFDEEQPNRRAIGATFVGTGAVFTIGGLIWLTRD